MLYTVTCNPALDYVMQVGDLQLGETNRASGERFYCGGKGINVAIVAARLGVSVCALGFVAGFTGDALQQMVERTGVNTAFIPLREGNTRINVKLKGQQETEINAGGPAVDAEALQQLHTQINALQAGDTLVLAGSVPPSLPQDLYARIACQIRDKDVRLVVDATGGALKAVLPYRPFLIKPNLRELEELAGRTLQDTDAVVVAARELQCLGAQNVLVSRGGDGALLLDADGNIHTVSAHVGTPRNTVGAGDSMVAGFLAGVDKGYAYALELGNAAGAATAFSDDLATAEEIEQLL